MSLKNDLIHGGLRVAASVGRRIPLPLARALGRATGRLAWHVVRHERRKALRHLESALPGVPASGRLSIARAMFRHLGTSLFEIAWLPNLDREALAATTRFERLDRFEAAVERGRGVVLFTGHCGNWEWMAAAIGIAGFRMNVIARELYDPRINDFVVQSRARHGVTTIGRGSLSSAREILQTLRSGAVLGVLIDQSIRAENVDLPFFGRPAPTPVGPARLAIRAGATAIAGFIERRGDEQIIRFDEPVACEPGDDETELTRTMSAAIERQIKDVPEQWVWMHDRWKPRTR